MNNPSTSVLLDVEVQWVPSVLLRTSLVVPVVGSHSPSYFFFFSDCKAPPTTRILYPLHSKQQVSGGPLVLSTPFILGFLHARPVVKKQKCYIRFISFEISLPYHLDVRLFQQQGECRFSPRGLHIFPFCSGQGRALTVLVVSTRLLCYLSACSSP